MNLFEFHSGGSININWISSCHNMEEYTIRTYFFSGSACTFFSELLHNTQLYCETTHTHANEFHLKNDSVGHSQQQLRTLPIVMQKMRWIRVDYIHINCTNAKPDTLIIYAGWATEKIYGFLKNAPVQRAKLQNSKPPSQKRNYGFRLGHVHNSHCATEWKWHAPLFQQDCYL